MSTVQHEAAGNAAIDILTIEDKACLPACGQERYALLFSLHTAFCLHSDDWDARAAYGAAVLTTLRTPVTVTPLQKGQSSEVTAILFSPGTDGPDPPISAPAGAWLRACAAPYRLIPDIRCLYSLLAEVRYEFVTHASGWEQICGILMNVVILRLREQEADGTEQKQPSYAARTMAYLEEHHTEDIDLDALAQDMWITPAYLQQLFRREYHTSIPACLRRLRIRTACALLADTATPISSIAFLCGFNSRQHFHMVFRQHMHMTPNAYRAQYAARGEWQKEE